MENLDVEISVNSNSPNNSCPNRNAGLAHFVALLRYFPHYPITWLRVRAFIKTHVQRANLLSENANGIPHSTCNTHAFASPRENGIKPSRTPFFS